MGGPVRHKLLLRQLKKLKLDLDTAPSLETWQSFLKVVANSYGNSDEGRYLLERALTLSSKEMKETFEKQKEISQYLSHTSKMAELGVLASGIAHELNNPLAGIQGHAEVLETSPNLDDTEKQKVGRILALTERAATTVRQLLKLARKPLGSEVKSLCLSDLVNESIEFSSSQMKYDNIDLKLDLGVDSFYVLGDSHRLQSVFQNLLLNSYHEFQRMDRSLDVSPTIWINAQCNPDSKDMIKIIYKDNAGGIPVEILPKIFDPFFTTKDVGNGTGLGLTLVRAMVEELGGNISAGNDGPQAVFTINLRRDLNANNDHSSAESGIVQSIKEGRPVGALLRKALIVDDEPDLLEILSSKLRGKFEIAATVSSTTALELAMKNKYDLLITDLRMPALSGQDLIGLVREIQPHIAICMVSGHFEAAQKYMDQGDLTPVTFIPKPLPKNAELMALIDAAFALVDKGEAA